MKPNFFIIGAARSGTTSLYLYLEQHPDIYFSDVKELNFFSNPRYWSKGFDWYESRFRPKNDNIRRIGDASTSYTRAPFLPNVPERVFNYAPEAKLIYIVRDPIARFISHYLHRVQQGKESRPISEIIPNLENESFAWQGCYCYQIEQFEKFFQANQICVISMEELKQSPQTLVSDIFRFLDVSHDLPLEKTGKVFNANKVTTRKTRLGQKMLSFYRRNLQQAPIPYKIKQIIQSSSEIGATEIDQPELTDEQRQTLQRFYEKDSSKLQEKYGIDTSKWFK